MTNSKQNNGNHGVIAKHLTASNIIIVCLVLFTILYVLGIFWLLSNGDIVVPEGRVLRGNWLWKRITSAAPNELGDTLAGIFAPLAFIWLAGTVVIQSQELKAQREEIRRSNTAFELQAKEMEATTKFIETQTIIMQAQDEDRKADEARNNIRWHLNKIYPNLKNHFGNAMIVVKSISETSDYVDQHITEFLFSFTAGEADWHKEGRDLFAKLIETVSNRAPSIELTVTSLQRATFENTIRVFLVVFEQFKKLPATDQASEIWIADFIERYEQHFLQVNELLENSRISFSVTDER